MKVRPARPSDVARIVDLVESAYRGETSRDGWTTEADLLDGQRTDAGEVGSLLPHLFVTDDLAGCFVLEPRKGVAYFGMFAVRPDRQGSGIGTALLGAAEERARLLGLGAIEMTVLAARAELLDFYERRGYTATGERRPFPYGDERFGRPRRPDLEFVVLRKQLGDGSSRVTT
ncbi:MAG TPA: GNAT family N-acetyltransferase [Acidimicrobiales bacterium]|nr:GNAT family N-acetyltransferase [Acidimicrobiales bacterium]